MKALHFGAGNIGRGFIGLILSENGYEITFADVNAQIVKALKQEKSYHVTLANDDQTIKKVKNVDAIHSNNEKEKLEQAILEADIITTAVGLNVLKLIAPSIAPILKKRQKPVNIIACENAINATDQLKDALESEVGRFDKHIHFSNAAVDRIVPIQTHHNILDVTVEPFYEWVIDSTNWHGPNLTGVKYVDTLIPFIERKLLTVNTGHAFLAYAGHHYKYNTILEAVHDESILDNLKDVLKETSNYLLYKYAFNEIELKAYRESIIERFKNPYLSDDITRVGRGILRKLGPNDRIMKPLNFLYKHQKKYDMLLLLAAYALQYHDSDDKEAIKKDELIKSNGIQTFLKDYTGIDEKLVVELTSKYQSIS
ncbi:mannitol-1-phosphate 5-dehydrogenase [Staphylococcus felis]|uniref:mannitol-1-phosphate 5-dehydrogenase n=1 Tax=Staphylococcus felis TaxID=46127 RepID=UPI003966D1BC